MQSGRSEMNPSDVRLERFVEAQDPVYESVCAELTAGHKTTHWMWFVFPQLKGLGRSATAKHFGLEGRDEAAACWRHPVLGYRLKHCTELVLAVQGKTAHEIFGSPDDLKLQSCMTLFEAVAPDETIFGRVLNKLFEGQRDETTLGLLGTACCSRVTSSVSGKLR
jgi:uncharacterized protein (DUF1810 family)